MLSCTKCSAASDCFQGDDLSETLASVLKTEPDLSAVPVQMKRLLTRCLQKDPKKRLRDIGDAWDYLEETAPLPAQRTETQSVGRYWIGVAVAFAAVAAAIAVIHFREQPVALPVLRTTIAPPESVTIDPFNLAVSPDGQRLAFSAPNREGKYQLWVRPMDGDTAQPLAGAEGGTQPFWSPDSRSIGFFADDRLKRIEAAGGSVTVLASGLPANTVRGGSWSPTGTIVYASGRLHRVPASGGPVTDITKPDTTETTRRPWFLPDGVHFLVSTGKNNSAEPKAIRLGSLSEPNQESGYPILVAEADSGAVYSAGHILYVRGRTLMAQPFDPGKLKTAGNAVPVVEGVPGGGVSTRLGFAASAQGLLIYSPAGLLEDLSWFDRKGTLMGTLGEPAGRFLSLSFSPDRSRIVATMEGAAANGIWLIDTARGVRTRFTFSEAVDRDPVFSPDGRTVFFSSPRRAAPGIYRKPADGSGQEELVVAGEGIVPNASPDGRFLLYVLQRELWILPDPLGTAGAGQNTGKPYRFLAGSEGKFSPDGRWVVYQATESGRTEIFVSPFPGPGGKRQVSTGSGLNPRWRRDGREIFYRAGDGRLMTAEVTDRNGVLEIGRVQELAGDAEAVAGLRCSQEFAFASPQPLPPRSVNVK